jgi:hypothetical protein
MLDSGAEHFGNLAHRGRGVMITSPRRESGMDKINRPPLIREPLMGKTGLLPSIGSPDAAMDRFAGTWRAFPRVGSRMRQRCHQECVADEGDLLDTNITTLEGGGQYVEIHIDNTGSADNLLAELLLEMRRLKSAYGDMPSIIIIDKTGRYGLLPMILPGQLATYSLAGDLTDKKYLEFWESLESADTFFKNCNLGYLFQNIRYFSQMGLLAAATQPAIHFHPTEMVSAKAKEPFPLEDRSVVDRLNDGEFGSEYVSKVVDDICVDKFVTFVDRVQSDFIGKPISETFPLNGFFGAMNVLSEWARKYRAGEMTQGELAKNIADDFGCISCGNCLENVLATIGKFRDKHEPLYGESDDSLYKGLFQVYREFQTFLSGDKEAGQLSYAEKKDVWAKQPDLHFPRARLAISAALISSVKPELDAVIAQCFEAIPATARERITVVISDKFGANGVFPGIKIEASSDDMGLYTKEISAKCDEILNRKWGVIFNILDMICSGANDRDQLMTALEAEIGLRKTLENIKGDGVYFEEKPGFSLGDLGQLGSQNLDIDATTENYLNYVLECFNFASKGGRVKKGKKPKLCPELHNSRVCPRAMVVEKMENGKFSFQVSPSIVFEPVADKKFLEACIGDWDSLMKIDARLRLLGNGLVAKSTGGDGFVDDFFMRRDEDNPTPKEGNYVFKILRELFMKMSNDGSVPAFFIHYLKKELGAIETEEGETFWAVFGEYFDALTPDEMHSLFQEDALPSWFKSRIRKTDLQDFMKLEDAVVQAKHQVEEKFKKADDYVPSHGALRNAITKNLSSVRVLIEHIFPGLNEASGSTFEARYFFQLAVDSALRTITTTEYESAKNSNNLMDNVHGGFVRKKGASAPNFEENEEGFTEQIRCWKFAKHLVEKSFKSVLEARDMKEEDNVRAMAFLVEEVSHILEQMAHKEPNLIGRIVDEGDEEYFKKIADFVATKLCKRGYNDEFFYSILPAEKQRKEGHVGMIRNCQFDFDSIQKECRLEESVPANVSALVRRAIISAYEIVHPKFNHGYKPLDQDGVLLTA